MNSMSVWDIFSEEIPEKFLYRYPAENPAEEGQMLTGILPIHGRELMTKTFGPCGLAWGYDIAGLVKVGSRTAVRIRLWYKPYYLNKEYEPSLVCAIEEYGGAYQPGRETLKKALSSALNRCFMALGHGASIYTDRLSSPAGVDLQDMEETIADTATDTAADTEAEIAVSAEEQPGPQPQTKEGLPVFEEVELPDPVSIDALVASVMAEQALLAATDQFADEAEVVAEVIDDDNEDSDDAVPLTSDHEGFEPEELEEAIDPPVMEAIDEPTTEMIEPLVLEEPVEQVETVEAETASDVEEPTQPTAEVIEPESAGNIVAFPMVSESGDWYPCGIELYQKFFATFAELKTKGIRCAFYHQIEGKPENPEGFIQRPDSDIWCKKVSAEEMPPAHPFYGLVFLKTTSKRLVDDLRLVERFGFRESTTRKNGTVAYGVSLTDKQIIDMLKATAQESISEAVNY